MRLTYVYALMMVTGCHKPIPLDDFPSTAAGPICDILAPCCNQAGLPFDHGTCTRNAQVYYQQLVDRAKASGATYDGEAAAQCMDAYRDSFTNCGLSSNFIYIGLSCARMFSGK